ncbi:protein kinase [Luteolibacter sp. SL250]|uniref:serine/threonine protein kinase n=1 Tax=Luteolibacter sp. SL250 TaxID=2995170 RepID=UPI002270F2A6|nr:serine/threonine protein kinase [Luteolibacter sp. SL250]WAC18344.1 protein kinase [Luteolibacter sp. SL250]
MQERYQIRGKLGQGGLGSVYRGYDTRMNREVAIKRISADGDPGLQKEATQQLQKEAGSLASLQHPNIVTVYDVDQDADGPYVVMELISGKTLDELVESAPLTFEDFKELAKQTQEGLIAAQELELVHRDIKPGNLMLNWLPSGKFQVKIVDFGLAKLMPAPTRQEIDQNDSVMGSIFFMAPEQFERAPLDRRVDMYAMGCVYYHALTGEYPFNGETGMEVMTAHLHHTVVPLSELRPDLPTWLCDWVMWQMNRLSDDRPPDARRSLHVFLQNESAPPPPPPKEKPPGPQAPSVKRPGAPAAKQIPTGPIQNTAPAAKTQSAPRTLTPPEGFKPSVHTSSVFVGDTLVPAPDPTVPPRPTTSMVQAKAASAAPTARMATPTAPTARLASPAKATPTAPTARLATPAKVTPTAPTVRGGSVQQAAPAAPTVRSAPTAATPGTRPAAYVPVPAKPKKQMKPSEKAAIWIAAGLIAAFIAFIIFKFGG